MRIYTGKEYEDKFYTKSYKFKNKVTGKYQTNVTKGYTVTAQLREAL